MANEITVTGSFKATSSVSGGTFTISAMSKTLDMTGSFLYSATVSVTSGAEVTVSIPSDIGNCGWIVVKNLDATNYVKLAFVTTEYKIRILAGTWVMFRPEDLALASFFLRAVGGDCQCQYWLVEA